MSLDRHAGFFRKALYLCCKTDSQHLFERFLVTFNFEFLDTESLLLREEDLRD